MSDYFSHIKEFIKAISFSFDTNCTSSASRRDKIIARIAAAIINAVSASGSAIIRAEKSNMVAYWTGDNYVTPNRDDHRTFLMESAIRAGMNEDEARTKRFLDTLEAQVNNMPDMYFKVDRDWRYKELIISFKNYTVYVSPSGQLSFSALTKERLPTVSLPFEYNPEASCPVFENYLRTSLPDEGTRQALLEYIGVCHIPFGHEMEPNLQKCAVAVGARDSGKTVLATILGAYFGGQAIHRQLATITQPDTFLRGDLEGKLVCISNDVDQRIANKEIFKSLVTGEPIEANRKHQAAIELTHYARLLIIGNFYPPIFCDDWAFYKRILPIPFRTSIPEESQNPDLAKIIINNELPGIANLVLYHLESLLQRENRAFIFSRVMADDLDAYQNNAHHVREFLRAAGYDADQSGTTSQAQLYSEYSEYCVSKLYSDRLTSSTSFGRALKNLGFTMKVIENQNFFIITRNAE